MRAVLVLALVALGSVAAADTVVATRTIRAQELIAPGDVDLKPVAMAGALTDLAGAIGQEARTNLYAGRPIRPTDVGPPALVDRNQSVVLNYHRAGLAISTEGRALSRGGVGERIRVMNMVSRTTVTGIVLVDGSVNVAATPY
ncbi:MAG: flagellar basal body P-ring formation chaperone FlgA [Qingshengfaniella sp.]